MYVKNENGGRLLVYVLPGGIITPKYPTESTEGYNLTTVYCLGCSWSGSPLSMLTHEH